MQLHLSAIFAGLSRSRLQQIACGSLKRMSSVLAAPREPLLPNSQPGRSILQSLSQAARIVCSSMSTPLVLLADFPSLSISVSLSKFQERRGHC